MKIITVFIIGLLLATGGLILRFNAMALARPQTASWGPGNWKATDWAFWQHAYIDVGNISCFAGFLIIALALHHWLKSAHRSAENPEYKLGEQRWRFS